MLGSIRSVRVTLMLIGFAGWPGTDGAAAIGVAVILAANPGGARDPSEQDAGAEKAKPTGPSSSFAPPS